MRIIKDKRIFNRFTVTDGNDYEFNELIKLLKKRNILFDADWDNDNNLEIEFPDATEYNQAKKALEDFERNR